MRTAALLPTPGDPFLVKHWLRNCELVWRGEVDDVIVFNGGQTDPDARAYLQHEVERIGGTYTERVTGGLVPHGVALNILITDCDADAVLLMEDDVRVRYPGRIRDVFRGIAEDKYDIAGSRRDSMTPELQRLCRERWPLAERMVDLSDGGGMWPAFVFARRECLMATDRDYGERSWGAGQTVPGLAYTIQEGGDTQVADTFGGAAFQLRAKYRVRDIEQWKGPWIWENWLQMYSDRISWFHCGSLSSSNNLGAVEEPVFQDGRTLTDWQEKGEWAHRLHWWHRCLLLHGRDLPEFALRYADRWERLRQRMGVETCMVENWDHVVRQLVTWPE